MPEEIPFGGNPFLLRGHGRAATAKKETKKNAVHLCRFCKSSEYKDGPVTLIIINGKNSRAHTICTKKNTFQCYFGGGSWTKNNLILIKEGHYSGKRVCRQEAEKRKVKCLLCKNNHYIFNETVREIRSKGEYAWICKDCIVSGDLRECYGCGDYYEPASFSLYEELSHDIDIGLNFRCNECCKVPGAIFPVHIRGIEAYKPCTTRSIGIEIECEPTWDSQRELAKWKDEAGFHMVHATTDNSLRGEYPVEYISPILYEDSYEEWIGEFCSRLKANVYSRCGYHAHIFTGDLETKAMIQFMKHCALWQSTHYFRYVSPRRIMSTPQASGRPAVLPEGFMSLSDTMNKKELIAKLYGEYSQGLLSLIKSNKRANDQNGPKYGGLIHRYHWMNFHGHFHRGVTEIRLHHGTTNYSKISNWVELWLSVVHHFKTGGSYRDCPDEFLPKHILCFYKQRAKEIEDKMGNRRNGKKDLGNVPDQL